MRILMIQPNYHAGGAEIAGNWPPGWVAYIGGALRRHGFTNLRFLDAMTRHIDDQQLEEIIARQAPDVVMATAITPMIYQAQKTLEIARRAAPGCRTILGGIHPTFMYAQVLGEAPWIDYIVRGEGEEIIVELMRAIADGREHAERRSIQGIAFLADRQLVATPARPVIEDLDSLTPDWSLRLGPIHLCAFEYPRGGPELRARLPVHLPVLLAVEVLAQVPGARSEEICR